MTYQDPNDPQRPVVGDPAWRETVETVVVRESNTGWWIAGILGGLVLLAVLWILFARGGGADRQALADAQADAALAQADALQAQVDSRVTAAQAGVDIARANASAAQAEAVEAASDARAAAARATPPAPVVIQSPAPAPAPSGAAVVTSTTPQN